MVGGTRVGILGSCECEKGRGGRSFDEGGGRIYNMLMSLCLCVGKWKKWKVRWDLSRIEESVKGRDNECNQGLFLRTRSETSALMQ